MASVKPKLTENESEGLPSGWLLPPPRESWRGLRRSWRELKISSHECDNKVLRPSCRSNADGSPLLPKKFRQDAAPY